MLKPKHSPLYTNKASSRLASTFTLLSWNMNKRTLEIDVEHHCKALFVKESVDIIALQEVKSALDTQDLYDFPSIMASNIQTKEHLYGTMTASKHCFKAYTQYLTVTRESFLTTRKSALVTSHLLTDKSWLTVVNIHAINFVSHYYYKKELLRLIEVLQKIKGPMIFCGDFNTWSQKRYITMMDILKDLGLKAVVFKKNEEIKRFNKLPLDHIFYRGLKVVEQKVLDIPKISDHNPLIATFSMI